jgi:hypothetical protein
MEFNYEERKEREKMIINLCKKERIIKNTNQVMLYKLSLR